MLKNKRLYILLLLITQVSFAQKSLDQLLKKHNTNAVSYIKAKQLNSIDKKAVILDTRETNEYTISHLKGAIPVGFKTFNLDQTIKKLPNKDQTIVVYCSVGIRANAVAKKLIDSGYTAVYNLYGGVFEWKNKGFKVFDTDEIETDKIHAFSKKWSKWLTKGTPVFDQPSNETEN